MRSSSTTSSTPIKSAHEMFYYAEDVMRLLGYSKSKSYKVIAALNRELEASGKCTCRGRVVRRYFDERYGIAPAAAERKAGNEKQSACHPGILAPGGGL